MQPELQKKPEEPEILATVTFFLPQYNNSRQTVDIFLLSLCVIHRHVARATKKGGGTRMCSCHLQLYIMYYTKNQPLQDYTTVSYAPTTMIAHTAKH